MYQGRKVFAIVCAGGTGTRMGITVPKQFLKLGQETILEKSCRAFIEAENVDEIVVVTNADYIQKTRKILEKIHGCEKIKFIVPGGKERQDSVYEGLKTLAKAKGQDLVLIHDGARPFVSTAIIERVLQGAYESQGVVCAVKSKDTVRQVDEKGSRNLKRETLYNVQTPQGFNYQLIIEAYEKAYSQGFYGTDDGGLVERLGREVKVVEGSYENIKITTKEDIPMTIRIGTGFDVHQLVEGRKLILGGEEIPYEKGLLGHSDADVLVHAFMDALLGAAALGDIGKHFPDTDEKYKGISSIELLKQVTNLLDEQGYKLVNGDITLIAQKPKIAGYIPKMRENIASAMGVDISMINIKGTTTEKLGFTGRGEGIACEAVCMLER